MQGNSNLDVNNAWIKNPSTFRGLQIVNCAVMCNTESWTRTVDCLVFEPMPLINCVMMG